MNVSIGGATAQNAAACSSGQTGTLGGGACTDGFVFGGKFRRRSKSFPSAGGGLCIRLIISALEHKRCSSFAPNVVLKKKAFCSY